MQLRKELVGGPLKNDGILHSIATEIYRRNASDREIFAESILRSTFSRLINNRCANSSQVIE